MKKILIPFDSSSTSKNVIEFAEGLLKQIKVEKVYIVQSYEISLLEEISSERSESRLKAENLVKEISADLQSKVGPDTQIKCITSDFPLLRSIHHAIANLEPELVLAGSDSNDEQSPIGDEIINIAKTSPVPVLVVPSECRYRVVKDALLPCNFADFSNLSLLEGIKTLEPVTLHLLNVDADNTYTSQRPEIEERISKLLSVYKHNFHYSDEEDVVEGILDFARNQDVQLVIALPGKHSFFYRLTHGSITQALTQNANRPVLLLKDLED